MSKIKDIVDLQMAIKEMLSKERVYYITFAAQGKVGPDFNGVTVTFENGNKCDVQLICDRGRKK